MPERKTIQRAKRDKRAGKSASTQAGEFVREEIHKIRRGEHGARSAKQAIAIGLSQARRAGVDLPPPKKGTTSEKTRKSAKAAYDAGHGHPHGKPSARRARATVRALKKEPRRAASHAALSRQAAQAARKKTHAERSAAARKGARTRARGGGSSRS
jgi:hypothetical protein